MKVALVFSGHFRSLEKTKYFWSKLIDKYDVDVYGSFWDEENYKFNDTSDNFVNIYNPTKLEVESYSGFKTSTVDILKLYVNTPNRYMEHLRNFIKEFSMLSMYYKIWRGNLLTKTNKLTYDVVIRARTDIIFEKDIEIFLNKEFNLPVGVVSGAFGNDIGLIDCFSYGNTKLMDYHSLLFLRMMEYLNAGHYIFPTEHLLLTHLSKINVDLRFIPNYMGIVRNTDDVIQWFNDFVAKEQLIESVCSVDSFGEVTPNENSEFKVNSIKSIFHVK